MESSDPLRILVVESDQELQDRICRRLRDEGFTSAGASTLVDAQAEIGRTPFEVLLVSAGLSDGSGLSLLKANGSRQMNVIVMSDSDCPAQRVQGLRLGADACVIKPVEIEEIVLVIYGLLQRRSSDSERSGQSAWILHQLNWKLTAPNGRTVTLTRSELLLLSELAKSVGNGVDRQTLIHRLGHRPEDYDWRRMEILVRRLRNKCENLLDHELPLRTVHGFGYAFTEEVRIESKGSRNESRH